MPNNRDSPFRLKVCLSVQVHIYIRLLCIRRTYYRREYFMKGMDLIKIGSIIVFDIALTLFACIIEYLTGILNVLSHTHTHDEKLCYGDTIYIMQSSYEVLYVIEFWPTFFLIQRLARTLVVSEMKAQYRVGLFKPDTLSYKK